MAHRTRHVELGHYLRTRRQGLSPEDVGIPAGPRRRARGLLREEVAILANVSTSWYELLERGHRIRPSSDRLDALADALRLDETNRRYLHALGIGHADSVLPHPHVDDETVLLFERFMSATDASSHPVYAIDSAGNLITWNAPAKEWYDDFSAYAEHRRNIGWWMFTSQRAKERLVDWEGEARAAVARFRFEAAFSRTTSPIHDTSRALCAESAEFARLWNAHDVLGHESVRRTFRHPRLGTRTFDLLMARSDHNPAMSIVFHLPAAE